MAKMYYTLEEVIDKLGVSEDRVKAMVQEGKLREFRDGGKLNYRASEVDQLASAGGDTGELALDDSEISLSPVEETPAADPLSLTGSGSAAAIDLSGSDSGSLGMAGSGLMGLEDSTAPGATPTSPAAASDFGGDALSLDEVEKDAMSGLKKDDTVVSNIGISVFDEDDIEIAADPMAKTMLTGGDDDLRLDGSGGGGSGLLDLTRESDDTSLGADLLEGIDMGDSGESMPTQVAEPEEVEEEDDALMPEPEPAFGTTTMVVGVVEPVSPAITGLLAAATITLILLGALASAISLEAWPGYLGMLGDQFLYLLLGTLVLGGIFAGAGAAVGNAGSKPKAPKAKKEKKPKKEKKKKGK